MPKKRAPLFKLLRCTVLILFLGRCKTQSEEFLCDEGASERTIPHTVTKDVYIKKYPFMVDVASQLTRTHICSGVLIAHDLALVPASCVAKKGDQSEGLPIVRMGSHSIRGNGVSGEVEERNVTELRVHKKYSGTGEKGYDVAILKLDGEKKDRKVIERYKSLGDVGESDEVITVGWFKASSIGAPSTQLQMIPNMDYVPRRDCKAMFDTLPETAVCAKPQWRAHCEWDTGAPLFLCTKGVGNIALAGIASFASSVCGKDVPYVYADVGGELRNWVEAEGLEDPPVEGEL